MRAVAKSSTQSATKRAGLRALLCASLTLATISLTFSFGLGTALASKQVVDYIGNGSSGTKGGAFTFPRPVALNNSGAGPGDKGDVYVVDRGFTSGGLRGNRIERLGRDDNGTPSDASDDSYFFISAWGADVDATPAGGDDYEICTVASDCQAAVASGGNGTAAGNGALSFPGGIAVDQDDGNVYVSDDENTRVNVYEGDGTFLRSFGFDVVASGPDDNGVGYELCVAANGDVCKTGLPGANLGQISPVFNGSLHGVAVSPADGNPATGTVFLGDGGNSRVNTYNLDGSAPSSFGSAANFSVGGHEPYQIAVDSRGIVYASDGANGGEIERYDSQNANGGGVGFLAPIAAPPLIPATGSPATAGLAVDLDSDAAGPDVDVLYALRYTAATEFNGGRVVQQFGPLNPPGLTAPPNVVDDEHGGSAPLKSEGIAVEEAFGRLFITGSAAGNFKGHGVYVLDNTGPLPTAALDPVTPVDSVTATTATVHATVNPNGPPALSYHLEYSLDGTNWISAPSVLLGTQTTPQAVSPVLDPPGGGLTPNTLYHVRLVAVRPFAGPVVTAATTFTTVAEKPAAETVGSPLRTTTTAQLEGRVNPRNSTTTYYFEYGDQGPCDVNPCVATDPQSAGSADLTKLVAQPLVGLQASTAYHYRLVADNGSPGGPAFGEDMIVTTRDSDAPLSHGHFAGPAGSDRAYEQINMPDTSGNPLFNTLGFAADGNRSLYQISGGTDLSDTGTFAGIYFAQRGPTGWQTERITPPRSELGGADWEAPVGRSDLSSVVSINLATATAGDASASTWRFGPAISPTNLFQPGSSQHYSGGGIGSNNFGMSADGSRVVELLLGGEPDPAYPEAGAKSNLYDISSGSTPQLVSLLPGNTVPACGTERAPPQASHWISAEGSRIFFPSKGNSCSSSPQLYMREVEAGQTKHISEPLSGPACTAELVKVTPGAAFFWTQSRLVTADAVPSQCGNAFDGDVYRYDIGDGSLACVTCVVPGLNADVYLSTNPKAGPTDVAVSEDGSRVYFKTMAHLLAGAPVGGEFGAYRVDTTTGGLAYVSPIGNDTGEHVGTTATGGNAISPDGSVMVFRSSEPSLNPLGGQDNGGTLQYYRYDDRDRSLVCVSCPADGSAPKGDVPSTVGVGETLNLGALSEDGGIFAFSTPTALVGADQNTSGAGQSIKAGEDVYEWREGRLFLITDGLTNWPNLSEPTVQGVSPSGRDIYFAAPAQYTPDAIDGYRRLYDARIGGGFDFPPPPPPCPLEVCQGTPKGVPEEPLPGTAAFSGPVNGKPSSSKSKKSKHKKGKHKKRQHKSAKRHANHDRRASR